MARITECVESSICVCYSTLLFFLLCDQGKKITLCDQGKNYISNICQSSLIENWQVFNLNSYIDQALLLRTEMYLNLNSYIERWKVSRVG